ncbi:MAG TPA: bifunctional polysaccharide deacetylase/glycosyltransferase family 2 protein, partial [Acidimicrobiia bacterium]|nr:bifunctional polysaccharide deacetylase/glycosyltransferase family 2 protein [Acidimicrobiia bacterium]
MRTLRPRPSPTAATTPARRRTDARRSPRLSRWRWVALSAMVLALFMALVVDGFARHEIGRSATGPAFGPAAVPATPGLATAGPVLDLTGPQLRSAPLPDKTVALTFDDGPDPKWTPEILDVLRRHGVPATFFVVGAETARHPELVRAELAAGHEIGAHTFTHTDLGAVSRTRAGIELSLTQTALAGAAGISTNLLRLPYSSEPVDLTSPELAAARRISDLGYLLVFATQDPEDWRQPGPASIVAHSTPPAGQGGIVLLHDAGGDRSQTVEAVDRLITKLQGQGYRFTTVSGLAGLPPGSAVNPVGRLAHLQGLALLLALQLASVVTRGFLFLVLPFTVLALGRNLAVVLLARRQVRQPRPEPTFFPPVSIIVPAYNEEVGIAAAVRSLAGNDYPTLEVIVVDDGSTDGTSAVVAAIDDSRVRLIRQPNAGKPAALNTGIAAAHHDVIVMVDGDTIFEPDTIRHLVAALADPTVGAVAGNTKVGNRRGMLGRWQHIEYVMGCNLDRRMYEALDCIMVVPGAIGAFRRQALTEVGGVSADTLAEDTDLTMAINRAGWRVVFESRARAWTEVPTSLRQLWRQRYRWAYGTMQAIWKHRGAVGERSALGLIGLPSIVLAQVVLPLLAPALDVFALYGVLFVDPARFLAYWVGFNVLGTLVALYAFRLDGESRGPLWALPLQQFVYRQLLYLVVFESVISAFAGTRLRWHKLTRTGDVVVGTPV